MIVYRELNRNEDCNDPEFDGRHVVDPCRTCVLETSISKKLKGIWLLIIGKAFIVYYNEMDGGK